MSTHDEKDAAAAASEKEPVTDEAAPAQAASQEGALAECGGEPSGHGMQQVAGVVFADGKVAEFDPHGLKLSVGDPVLVDNAKDLNLGRVVFMSSRRRGKPLARVIRRVGSGDLMLIRRNKKREEEALQLCSKLIEQNGLPMKLIRVAYLHGGNKAIFYFSADGRVDFRSLVRDLAKQLHVRIEMRQIGVRDESKMLGGIGICGQQLCCSRFLRKFSPVSIKMAKNQNLALNPQKLSGLCGRLMCCLVYEDKTYREQRKLLPRVGKEIETPLGTGKVIDLDIPGCRVRVQIEDRQEVLSLAELSGEKKIVTSEPGSGRDEKPRERERKPRGRAAEKRKTDGRARAARTGADKAKAKPASEGAAPEKKKRKRRSRRRSRKRKNKTKSQAGQKTGAPGKPAAKPADKG